MLEQQKKEEKHKHPDQPGREDCAIAQLPDDKFEKPDPNSGITRTIAEFVAQANIYSMPEHGVSRLKDFVLDFTGIAAYASQNSESSPSIRKAICHLDPDENGFYTVIGDNRGYTESYAALLNGVHAHSLEFEDTNRIQTGHPGAPVIAATFAEAERIDATGDAFFNALAVGYEVACRVGVALGLDCCYQGFHITAISGIYGAVAAISRLRSFSPQQIEDAFGLALSKAAGSMEYLVNGSYNKRLHPGFAASDAILCATLAEAGVIGAGKAFEGPFGLLHAYTPKPRPSALTDNLGSHWLLLETAIKPYPSCRLTHGAIDAMLQLRDQIPENDRAKAKIEIKIPKVALKITGEHLPNKVEPKNIVDAQFSIYFQVASALNDGQVTLDSYNKMSDPQMLSLIKNIKVTQDDSLPSAGATIDIDAGDKKLSATVKVPLGEPDNWIGEDQLRHKFLHLASNIYGEEQAIRIANAICGLGMESSVRSVLLLTRRHKA